MVRALGYPLAQQMMQALQDRGYRDTAHAGHWCMSLQARTATSPPRELRNELPHLGRATIYRSLKILWKLALCAVCCWRMAICTIS